ncbi:MAG: transposase [Chloroflexi bacterium]|nr:transposase [Chloroflexota bacterium]
MLSSDCYAAYDHSDGPHQRCWAHLLRDFHPRCEQHPQPGVIQRKISGGTRSAAGTRTLCTLATLFGTWRARNLDPLQACR